jgi:hypothetical protein
MISVHNGGSAVAVPVGPDGGVPQGDVTSILTEFAGDSDFALAVSRDYIMSLIDKPLADLKSAKIVFTATKHDWLEGTDTQWYTVRINAATAHWSAGKIHIEIEGDTTNTGGADWPDVSFTISQDLILGFDAGSESLTITKGGAPSVHAHSASVFAPLITGPAEKAISGRWSNELSAALKSIASSLEAPANQQQDLVEQLQTIDRQASTSIDSADFNDDGVILRGTISLAPRKRPVVNFDKTLENDGFSALFSWIPGGRIDQFEWSWNSLTGLQTGRANHDDRFVLRPERTAGRQAFLGPVTALPGISGFGSVCLAIKGQVIDPVTGEWVDVETSAKCTRFAPEIPFRRASAGAHRLLVRDIQQPKPGGPRHEVAQIALGAAQTPAANTLLLYAGERVPADLVATLERGLEQAIRPDLGLNLIVLLKDGQAPLATDQVGALDELGAKLGVGVLVTEDVGGSWAAAMRLGDGAADAWWLLSPGGGLTWKHDGALNSKQLGETLHGRLLPSVAPEPGAIQPAIEPGVQLPASLFEVRAQARQALGRGRQRSHCPPPPVRRAGAAGAVIGFVRADSAASQITLGQLADRYDSERRAPSDPLVVLVVDGVDERGVESMKNELGVDFGAMADPTGAIADRISVRAWPTLVRVDPSGFVTAIQVGANYDGGQGEIV